MIRVTAASRLHFGLFALPAQGVSHWPDCEGQPSLPARHFGGVGLMIDQPGVRVALRPASGWSAEGPCAERALQFGRRFLATLPHDQGTLAFHVNIEQCAPEHVGLGVGTQLGLATARALALATAHANWDAVELARRVGRGLRSSIGIHGFQHGGLIIEAGKTYADAVAPLLIRRSFPADWRILLIVPRDRQGTHGADD